MEQSPILRKFELNSERQIQLVRLNDGRFAIFAVTPEGSATTVGLYDSFDSALKDFDTLNQRLRPKNAS